MLLFGGWWLRAFMIRIIYFEMLEDYLNDYLETPV